MSWHAEIHIYQILCHWILMVTNSPDYKCPPDSLPPLLGQFHIGCIICSTRISRYQNIYLIGINFPKKNREKCDLTHGYLCVSYKKSRSKEILHIFPHTAVHCV